VGQLGVVIASAGRDASLERTIRALFTAVEALDGETVPFVVVDDTVDEAPERRQLLGDLGVLSCSGGGGGAGPARNLGAQSVEADWLLFVDDDVEVDPRAVIDLLMFLRTSEADVVLGLTRPPTQATRWVADAYRHGLIGPAPAPDGISRPARGIELASGLYAIRREVFLRCGGYPDDGRWGVTDLQFGLSLERHRARVTQLMALSGVHHYVPTWSEWLERRRTAGERLAGSLQGLPEHDATLVLKRLHLDSGLRSWPKRLASRLPSSLLRAARGKTLRRLAGAGMEAKGFRRTWRAK
jgi:glycosyltransferase involved in cell wall biosynthesis